VITMDRPDAIDAMQELHGSMIDGRMVQVEKYIPKVQREPSYSMKEQRAAYDRPFGIGPAFETLKNVMHRSVYRNMHFSQSQIASAV